MRRVEHNLLRRRRRRLLALERGQLLPQRVGILLLLRLERIDVLLRAGRRELRAQPGVVFAEPAIAREREPAGEQQRQARA